MSYDGQTDTTTQTTDTIDNPVATDRSPGAGKIPADKPGNTGLRPARRPKKALQGSGPRKAKKACALDGADNVIRCGKPVHAQKRCKTHYQQWFRLRAKCKAPGCSRIQRGHYYCRPHERLALSERSPEAQAETLAKFRNQVEADPATGCWLWTGNTNDKGYGLFSTVGGNWLAHRFAYVWFCGGHAQGKVLDHICNTVNCVRPDHLQPITNTKNISLMHTRNAADDKEFWRHTKITPRYLSMIAWSVHNELPHHKPTRMPVRTAREALEDLRLNLSLSA